MLKLTRRAALLGAGAAIGAWGAGRWSQEMPSRAGTRAMSQPISDTILNDASELSATPIHKHITLSQDAGDALIDVLRAEMREAVAQDRPINVSAARHSMGGQAIPRGGTAITFDNGGIELDTHAQRFRCHAGARWSQVIAALDPAGFSPAVMQSNNDFGVAATFCVNAHGWPVPFGPMGATVHSFRLLVPTGDVVTCSRGENVDLFNLTMGGYGLTGAIIDMDVDMVPNQRLTPSFERMAAVDFAPAFAAAVQDDSVNMAYGRLNVDRENFLSEALLVTYRPTEDQDDLPEAAGSGTMSHLARHIYRAQLGRERIKRARWWFEADLAPRIAGGATTRNSLINEPVVTLDDGDPSRTDILHEYFVPFDRFGEFLQACRDVIPASFQSFLNVTLRFVDRDPESLLSYATTPRIAAVMSFSQEKTARAEADMARMTRALIARITSLGGAYYLPYRPHATQGQFLRTYERAGAFAQQKRALDPSLLYRNNLWDTYLEALS